jgi:hypothetical protein
MNNGISESRWPNISRTMTSASRAGPTFHEQWHQRVALAQYSVNNDVSELRWPNISRTMTSASCAGPTFHEQWHQRVALAQYFANNDISKSRWHDISIKTGQKLSFQKNSAHQFTL